MPSLRRPGPPPWWSPSPAGPVRTWDGAGPTVVLVHGPGQSSRSLVPLGRRLAALGLPVLAPDLREDAALEPHLPDEPVVLVGCSGGSRAAVELAVAAPERVRALVLSGPSVDPASRPAWRHALRVVRGSVLEVPSRKPQLLREDLRPGLRREVARLRADARRHLEERLPLVRVPAVVVRGAHDVPVSAAWARTAADLLPDGALVEVQEAAHDLHWSAPQVLARLVQQVAAGGLGGLGAGEVVPRLAHDDALAPPHLLRPGAHVALELATAVLALRVPVQDRRTRLLLRAAGAAALGNGLLARRLPLPLHRNLDSGGGLLLLAASALLLRGAPRAERLAVAALGLGTVVTADVTGTPVGPAVRR